jgi:hypothetical protein
MRVTINKTNGNYTVDDVNIHKYERVVSYEFIDRSILTLDTDNQPEQQEPDVYYIFDASGLEALFHWIAESFIFYPIFLKLKETYPNIKILTANKKKYVKNVFTLFDISDDICYNRKEIVNDKIIYNICNPNNICFFSPILSLNEIDDSSKDIFVKYIYNYAEKIQEKLSNVVLYKNKVLLMPRNAVDNYEGNSRILYGIQDIENNIIEKGGVVLNTYQINNLLLQFSIVNSSDTIIVNYGSAYYFNFLFVRNKKIIVLDYYLDFWHIEKFLSYRILHDIICRNNEVTFVNPKRDNTIIYADIVDL